MNYFLKVKYFPPNIFVSPLLWLISLESCQCFMSTFGILRLGSTLIYLFIHLLNKQLLITHYVPSNLLNTENLIHKWDPEFVSRSFRLMGRQTNKQIIIMSCDMRYVWEIPRGRGEQRSEVHLRENFLKRGIWHPITEHFWDPGEKNSELWERKCIAGVSGRWNSI